MDTKVFKHNREVYHLLDYIGDCGGVLEGVTFIFGSLLSILYALGFTPLQVYLVNSINQDEADKNTITLRLDKMRKTRDAFPTWLCTFFSSSQRKMRKEME